MKGPRSLEIISLLADLGFYGVTIASSQLAKICLEAYGGSNRAYITLLRRLEKSGHISLESNPQIGGNSSSWVPRLTAKGKAVIGSPSPLTAWESKWDGKWRLITFDLPSHDSKARFRLRERLKMLRFGKLQGSVWISHRNLPELETSFAKLNVDSHSILCIEGNFWNSPSPQSYVENAWPLNHLQSAYSNYLRFLDTYDRTEKNLKNYQSWSSQEQSLWSAALKDDPLLPQELWPQNRLGNNLALEAEARRTSEYKNWLSSAPNW